MNSNPIESVARRQRRAILLQRAAKAFHQFGLTNNPARYGILFDVLFRPKPFLGSIPRPIPYVDDLNALSPRMPLPYSLNVHNLPLTFRNCIQFASQPCQLRLSSRLSRGMLMSSNRRWRHVMQVPPGCRTQPGRTE